LIIQTQEKVSDGLEKKVIHYRIYIKNIKLEMNEMEDLDHCVKLMNEDFLMPVQLTQSFEDERRIEYKGILPSEFEFLKKGEMMYFYSAKALQSVMFSYNLQARKIEFVHVFDLEDHICGVITSPKADEKLFMFFEESRSNLLEYYPDQKCFTRKGISESKSSRAKKYQYGRFDKLKMEYMIFLKDDEFYLFDFATSLEWKIVSKSSLGTERVFSWTVYENLLTVIYDKCDVYLFKLPLAEICKGKVEQAKLIGSKWIDFASYLSNANYRILMYMNETCLVLVNIPGNATYFDLVFIYLADIILNCSFNLNKHWRIKGDELISKNSSLFLKRLEDPDMSFDLVKFEDDKVLIKFENIHLFFDLKSNFNESQQLENVGSQRDWLETTDLQIRLPVEILTSEGNKRDVVSESKKFQFQDLIPNKNCPLEKEKNIFEFNSDSDSNGECETSNRQKKRQLRKQIYFGIKKKIFRLKCVDEYVIGLFNLKTISVDRQKEWVLRQLKRRKTNIKNTFERRLHT